MHKSNRQFIAKTEILAIFPRKKHDTGNLYAGLPQAAGLHPKPNERDSLQEQKSREMKRDVQTLRLHVSFWWARQELNPRPVRYERTALTN